MFYLKYSITIVVFIIALSCKAQQIIDMSANNNMDGKYQNGTYYHKDVNNYLDAFAGIWKYEYDTNKEFRLTLTKFEIFHELDEEFNFNYYTDGLYISYQLYENDTLTYQSPIDNGGGLVKNASDVSMMFLDYGRLEAPFNLYLTLVSELGNQGGQQQEPKLKFKLSKWEAQNPYHSEHPNEPYFSVPNDILMTKVE
tara:strand:- start:139 stop:729 length:591 start_codon:yes stop_codon:yes gene_type:complete